MILDGKIIEEIIDNLLEQYGHLPGVRSISEAEDKDGTFFILTVDNPKNFQIPKYFTYESKNIIIKVKLQVKKGPKIIPFYYKYENKQAMLSAIKKVKPSIIGGDKIWNFRLNGYGTVGFTAKSLLIQNNEKKCKGRNLVISNNHVLALWDKGKKGDNLNTPWHNPFAKLYCWFRVKKTRYPTDIALGQLIDANQTSFYSVRGIGTFNSATAPKKGMKIQKYGARTHLTKGKVGNLASIRVNGVWFRWAREASRGFACPGDSGSSVFTMSNKLVGWIFAGENIPCENKPKTYFIGITDVAKINGLGVQIDFNP